MKMERISLVELHRQRQRERIEKGESHKRLFRINPDGDIYLLLNYYSEERISARNMRTSEIEQFSSSSLVIPENS